MTFLEPAFATAARLSFLALFIALMGLMYLDVQTLIRQEHAGLTARFPLPSYVRPLISRFGLLNGLLVPKLMALMYLGAFIVLGPPFGGFFLMLLMCGFYAWAVEINRSTLPRRRDGAYGL